MISPSPLSPKDKVAEEGFEPGISDSKIHTLSQNWLLLTRNATSHYLFPQRLAHSH